MEIRWARTKISLKLFHRSVNVNARVVRVVRFPNRNWRAPKTVAANCPVANILQPLTKRSVFGVLRCPINVFVQLQHAIAKFCGFNEPRRDSFVNQRILAAIAVRVGVLVRGLTKNSTSGLQVLGNWLVRFEDVLAFKVGDDGIKFTAFVDRNVGRNSCIVANTLVILTIGRCLVNDSSAIAIAHIVVDQNLPGVIGVEFFRINVVIK